MPYIPVSVVNEGLGLTDFGPPPVAGYVNWYDFADLSTITLSPGQMITVVTDKGSGGNNLSQTLPGVTLVRVLPSLRPAAFFADGYLSSSAGTVSDLTSSWFTVACLSRLNGHYTLFGPNADDALSQRIDITTGQLSTTLVDTADIATQSNANLTPGVPFVAGCIVSATDVTQYMNTVSETDAYVQTATAGRTLAVGLNPSGAVQRPWRGWIGELVVYDTTLSPAEAELNISHFMSKWSIS